MKKICMFGTGLRGVHHGYELDHIDPAPYFTGTRRGGLSDLVSGGLDRWDHMRALLTAEEVDTLYRRRDPAYLRFVDDFVDRFAEFDVLVMSAYNCVHPEVLHQRMPRPIKILGFVDDPYSTYSRGVPYLWAFDGAFYITPGYLGDRMTRALERWGCRQHYFWPLCAQTPPLPEPADERFFSGRTRDVVYVGRAYAEKLDRLITMRNHLGPRFEIHGAWSWKGYKGLLPALSGRPALWQRVRPLSHDERTSLYLQTKIGFNMHRSPVPTETGNMRMFEVPTHGMMLLCDKGAVDTHAAIFVPDREAVFYDSTEDAIAKAEYYLAHDRERIEIAWRGFERARRDYDYDRNLKAFLDWAAGVARRAPRT